MEIVRNITTTTTTTRPLFISTNPSHVKLNQLTHLFTSSHFSTHRFPNLHYSSSGNHRVVEAVNVDKLRIALLHSSVVVSVFCKPSHSSENNNNNDMFSFGRELMERVVPVSESNGELVGFGRAVSDNGLTASIHDIVVLPWLQRMGIGRKIVQRILRVLVARDIYDIGALCSEKERLFFEACGFGDDILGSTAMMYTRAPPALSHYNSQDVKHAGRMLLLVPQSRQDLSSSTTND
ncbi:hypothetical protein GIB67_041084 [Kingdonia uniflora]|uniref:N-acetyltransferase domain-containing protein n=1 Tax=Kingdonia uniflora TaxID=39325 RepID=A0A7J7LK32_9MAGN|nr:hypothetical protein GIB67_041084 [Kingdonia uniflora]